MSAPTVCWIVPPLELPPTEVFVPSPSTVKLPVVFVSTMPLAGSGLAVLLPAEMLLKVAASTPLLTLIGVPAVVVLLRTTFSETVSVPKPLPLMPRPVVFTTLRP